MSGADAAVAEIDRSPIDTDLWNILASRPYVGRIRKDVPNDSINSESCRQASIE
jgi:hypothetical protein